MSRNLKEVGSQSYVSTENFHNSFLSYTVTRGGPPNFEVRGTLSRVRGANSTNCPAGRVLRENGKKLYPEANPGVLSYLVGVYDSHTGLKGYISPDAGVFATYNGQQPLYIPDVPKYLSANADFNSVYNNTPTLFSQPVNTDGTVIATGQVYSSGRTELSIIDGIPGPSGRPNIARLDVSKGQLFVLYMTKDVTLDCGNISRGAHVYLVVYGQPGGPYTLSFANNANLAIRTAGPLEVATSKYYTLHFICDDLNLMYEVGRSAELS